MRKPFMLTAIILCFSLIIGGCSERPPATEQDENKHSSVEKEETPEQSKLNVIRPSAYSSVNGLALEPGSSISIIGRYADNSFWKEVEAGATQAVEDLNTVLGYKGDKKIELSYCAPDNYDDMNEQINILDEELSRYPIAIGIAAIDMSACSLQFDLAAENSIPIVTLDSGSEYSHVASHISTDNYKAAATAASKLAHAINESGEIAIIMNDSTSTTGTSRLQGFQDKLTEDYPEVKVVTVYHLDELTSMADVIAAEKNLTLEEGAEPIDPASISQEDIIQYILEKNPNLKGFYTANLDTTQLVSAVVSDLERTDLKIVGFDGGEEQIQLLKDGIVEGLILQNPFGMGYATVVAAARAALGLPNESIVDTGYTWVTNTTLEDITIKNMLY